MWDRSVEKNQRRCAPGEPQRIHPPGGQTRLTQQGAARDFGRDRQRAALLGAIAFADLPYLACAPGSVNAAVRTWQTPV